MEANGFSLSKIKHRVKIFTDLIVQNPHVVDFEQLVNRYHMCTSAIEKIKLRFGENSAHSFQCRLRARPLSAHRCVPGSVDYWVSRGMSREAAQDKVSTTQSNNSKKRHAACKDYAVLNPSSMKYWLARDYTVEEAQELRQPYVDKSPRTRDAFIKRYGPTEGVRKFDKKIAKRLETMKARYGTTVTNGCVSKESLRVFVPLYKHLRRRGIDRADIMWGITGSREFATRADGVNYFYDFTVRSRKIIIEYNNTFWHPHPNHPFNNPFVTRATAEAKETAKRKAVEQRGFKLLCIWDFEDKQQSLQRILQEIYHE